MRLPMYHTGIKIIVIINILEYWNIVLTDLDILYSGV